MAVGAPPGPLAWNRDMLELMPVDLLGVSIYTGEGGREDDYDTKIMDLDHFYRHVVAEPLDFDRDLGKIITAMGDRFPSDRPLIAVTEYQAWWLTEKVDEDFRLCNALYLAGVFHALMRRSRQVAMGEIESLINVQGIVEVSQTSVKLTPEYFACLLYRHHTGSSVLAASTQSPMTAFNAQLPDARQPGDAERRRAHLVPRRYQSKRRSGRKHHHSACRLEARASEFLPHFRTQWKR